MIAVDYQALSHQRAPDPVGYEHRQWVRQELCPYIRAKGGVVKYEDALSWSGKDANEFCFALDMMRRTVHRYEDTTGDRLLVIFDAVDMVPPQFDRVLRFDRYDTRKRVIGHTGGGC